MTTNNLPSTVKEWHTAVEREGLKGISIHNQSLVSASKFELHHFLPMRVLWVTTKTRSFNPSEFFLDKWMEDAKAKLTGYGPWGDYRKSFDKKKPEGELWLARVCQKDVFAVKNEDVSTKVTVSHLETHPRKAHRQDPYTTPTKTKNTQGKSPEDLELEHLELEHLSISGSPTSSAPGIASAASSLPTRGPKEAWPVMYPDAEDEQLVNSALVIFLKAITLPFLSDVEWTMSRKAFKVKFGTAQYEARTDGYLRYTGTDEVRALIEVKAALRPNKESEIRMQESAQMVAWLMTNPELALEQPARCVHVCQDRHEGYVIFPVIGKKYLDYLNGHVAPESHDPETFMTMREIGPFSTNSRSAMTSFAATVLGLALRADHDRKQDKLGR